MEANAPGTPSAVQAREIPDHELLCLIGRGAYGEVWLARNAIGTLRAVKIVHRQSFERNEHFEREFKGLLKFEPVSRSHGGMVHVLQIGRREEAGYFFYVMELADAAKPRGENGRSKMEDGSDNKSAPGHPPSSILDPQNYEPCTLRLELQRHKRLPPAECVAIGLKLASALKHLHANGLVHRDIKPSNIIFVNGEPKLADIGLVTAVDEAQSLVGTAGYIPPEGPGTPQADLYSLGKVLYEIAFGKDRQEFPQLPPDLQSHPDYAALLELNEMILKACETDPRQRYQSAEAISDDLELLNVGKSVRQKRTRQQQWVVAKKVLVTAAVLGVLAVSATILWQQSRVTRSLSSNPQAVQLYRQAVYQLHSGTLDRHMQAYTNLLEAVKLDPKFVDAYYMLFEAYFGGDFMPPYYNQLTNSRVVVAKLRELSPNSAQYYTADSSIKFMEWKFDDAVREVKRAIQIDPQFVRAHGVYAGDMIYVYGDAKTALKEYQIAENLDPEDTTIQSVLVEPYFLERRYDEAIAQAKKALQLEPRAVDIYFDLFQAYDAAGQYDKALDSNEQFELAGGIGSVDPDKVKAWYQLLRKALREQGPRGVWEARLKLELQNPSGDLWWVAVCHARLGDTNEVMLYLNRAYNEHNGSMVSLLYDQYWDPYRTDPRFQALVKKMGFHPKH